MTRPGSRPGARRPAPAMAAAMAGAVDLSVLKERAQAKAQAAAGGADGGDASVVAVTEATFEDAVLRASMELPIVVALISSRSPASLALADTLSAMARADGGTWVLATVDADANMRIAQAFGITAIPAVIAVAAGQPLADLPPGQPEPAIRQWIDAVLKAVDGKLSGRASETDEPADDPRFLAAEQALADGDFDGAEAAYRLILNSEPANAEAKAALRNVGLLRRIENLAPDAVAQADANPGDVELALAAADHEIVAQEPDKAFTRLIALIKATAGAERTAVRTRLLELFELFDPADPIVIAGRRQLASALY